MEWERKRSDGSDLEHPSRVSLPMELDGMAQVKRTGDYRAIWLSILSTLPG